VRWKILVEALCPAAEWRDAIIIIIIIIISSSINFAVRNLNGKQSERMKRVFGVCCPYIILLTYLPPQNCQVSI
jgi:uncharacterized membrane protein